MSLKIKKKSNAIIGGTKAMIYQNNNHRMRMIRLSLSNLDSNNSLTLRRDMDFEVVIQIMD